MQEIETYRQHPIHLDKWDADVTAARTDAGQTFFVFRHLCEATGINYSGQLQVLREHPDWYPEATALRRFQIRTAGGMQEMICLRRKEAAWWLGHVNPKRCKPEIAAALSDFQADLMAAADRLAWGDLSDIPDATKARGLQRPVRGEIALCCPRCAALLRLVLGEDGAELVIG